MKIAFCDSSDTLGGAQRFLLDTACGLLARSWHVSAIARPDSPLASALAKADIPVIPAPTSSGWRDIITLAFALHRGHIRHLFVNTADDLWRAGWAMRLAGGKVSWRIQQRSDLQAAQDSQRELRLCSSILPVHDSLADIIRSAAGRTRLQTIRPAINTHQFPVFPPNARRKGERPVVGMVGSWSPLDGYDVLLRAFCAMRDSGLAARLRLACLHESPGVERFQSVVHSAVKAAGLRDRVVFEGVIHDLQGFLAKCDVIVMPTVRESSGRIALEAGAVGRPMVASRVAGLNEIVRDGHTGLLVTPNDPGALADALALLLVTPALRAEMGRQARVHIEEEYNLEAQLDALEELLLGRRSVAWHPTAPCR